MVNLASGTITTFAGTGTAGFGGDGGQTGSAQLNTPNRVAVKPDGKQLLISDTGNHRVRAIDLGTGAISTLTGTATVGLGGEYVAATLAALNGPVGVAYELKPTGPDPLIADTLNIPPPQQTGCEWEIKVDPASASALRFAETGGFDSATVPFELLPNLGTQGRSISYRVHDTSDSFLQPASSPDPRRNFIRLLCYSFLGRMPSFAEVELQIASGKTPRTTDAESAGECGIQSHRAFCRRSLSGYPEQGSRILRLAVAAAGHE